MKTLLFLFGSTIQTAFAQNAWEKYCEPFGACGSGRVFIIEFFVRTGNLIFMAIGGTSVVAIIWASFGLVTGAWNDQKREGAKTAIQFALGGLFLAMMGGAFVHLVKLVTEGLVGPS